MADVENIMIPDVAVPTCPPATALSLMPTVSSWNHVQTPATGRGTGRLRPVPAAGSVPATDSYPASHNYTDDTFRAVISDVATVADPDANAAALAKQGAPPRGEPR